MMPEKSTSYQELLAEELRARKAQNPQFSMRSFAKYLSISPAQLSQMISGKRGLSKKQALKIADRLGLTPQQVRAIMSPLASDPSASSKTYEPLDEETFRKISDWKHYAILSLGSVARNRADPKWISRRLGVSESDAEEAFRHLLDLGFVQVLQNGSFKQSTRPLTISSPAGSSAIRNFHKTNLELAKEKIENYPTSQRDFSSITLAMNPKKVAKAKSMIAEFRRAFAAEMEIGEKTDVYTIAIQLYPLTRIEG